MSSPCQQARDGLETSPLFPRRHIGRYERRMESGLRPLGELLVDDGRAGWGLSKTMIEQPEAWTEHRDPTHESWRCL